MSNDDNYDGQIGGLNWPPRDNGPKRGRATRLLTHNINNTTSSTPQPRTLGREDILDRVADSLAHKPSCFSRLVDRTKDTSWSPGKRKLHGHPSDIADSEKGGNVVTHQPLVIQPKRRHGLANDVTTRIISSEIEKRNAQREHAVQILENSRPFHSMFSDQPVHGKGTAHVKPLWTRATVLPSMAAQGGGGSGDGEGNSGHHNNKMPTGNEPPSDAFSPFGLPGVGQVDQARAHRRGKHQCRVAHQLTTFVDNYRPLAQQQQPSSSQQQQQHMLSFGRSGSNNDNSVSGEFLYSKLSDGSRGLRVHNRGGAGRDQVKESFETNPVPLDGRGRHMTTSSTIGNADSSAELRQFVHGSTRGSGIPNTRHFLPSVNSTAPIGAPQNLGMLRQQQQQYQQQPQQFRSQTPNPSGW